jgi:SAM-dependent methyltransferase
MLTMSNSTDNLLKRKREGKVSNRVTKKLMAQQQKTLSTISQKIKERLKRHHVDPSINSNVCLIFARIAYDLARSGTKEHIEDLESISNQVILPIESSVSRTTSDLLMDQCVTYAESAFLLSLSGVGVTASSALETAAMYDTLFQNAFILIRQIFDDPAITASELNPALLTRLLTAIELFAASGLCEDTNVSNLTAIAAILHNRYTAQIKSTTTPTRQAPSDTDCSPSGAAGWWGVAEFLEDIRQRQGIAASSGQGKCHWLHSASGRPLSALWKHSTKQKKVRSSTDQLVPGTRLAKLAVDKSRNGAFIWAGDSPLGFQDMTLPLVIDIGCGFGVSLLGLATSNAAGSDMNYLGCDLSTHCIDYARGLAARWDLSSRCRFAVAPAEDFLVWVRDHYPGPVSWILIQFPTPFKLELPEDAAAAPAKKSKKGSKQGGNKVIVGRNSQLPVVSMRDDSEQGENSDGDGGFMVSRRVVSLVMDIVKKVSNTVACGVYAQSNVEDVAVLMKKRFDALLRESEGIVCEHMVEADSSMTNTSARQCMQSGEVVSTTKRQQIWASAGGKRVEQLDGDDCEEAVSSAGTIEWMTASPWGIDARTETEAAYGISGKAVYRIGCKIYTVC